MSSRRRLQTGVAATSLAWLLSAGVVGCERRTPETAVEVAPEPSQTEAASAEAIPATIRLEEETLKLADLKIEPAAEVDLPDRLEVTGTVEPDLSSVVRVTPRVAGKVTAVRVNVGDTVKAGQILATLSSTELAEAQAEYHHARHQLGLARKNLKRQQELARLGAFGQPRVEDARARAVTARGEISVAENELTAAKNAVAEARSELAALKSEIVSTEAEVARVRSDIAEADADVRVNQAALAQAQTAHRVAQSKFERYQILLKEQLVSRQDWEQSQAEAQKARSDIDSAQANVARAKARAEAARANLSAAQARVAAARGRAQQAEAKIDSAVARQAQCEARLATAQKSASIASETLVREEAVFKGKFLTSKEIVEAESAVQEAEHHLEAAITKVRLLGGTPGGGVSVAVTAPLAGKVTERQVTLGEMVTTDKALFTVVNLNTVWVQLDLYQKDLPRVRSAQTVVVTTDVAPGKKFDGVVSYIGDQVDATTRTVKVRCAVRNVGGVLRPSVFVRGAISNASSTPVLAVPADAVQDVDGQKVVYLPADTPGEFRPQPVETGAERDGWVEVRSGLSPGQRVVTRNAFFVKAQAMKGELAED